jgi:hypothetical protein
MRHAASIEWNNGDVKVFSDFEDAIDFIALHNYVVGDAEDRGDYSKQLLWADDDAADEDDGRNAIAQFLWRNEDEPIGDDCDRQYDTAKENGEI